MSDASNSHANLTGDAKFFLLSSCDFELWLKIETLAGSDPTRIAARCETLRAPRIRMHGSCWLYRL